MSKVAENIRAIVLPLAIGLGGALLFKSLGVPAPLLTGSVVAVALAGLAGVNVDLHWIVRLGTFLLLGCRIGAAVRPDVFQELQSLGLSITVLALCALLTMSAAAFYLRVVHKFDRTSATLSAIPGALPFVLALADRSDGDNGRVAIIQVMRLICLVVLLPILLTYTGLIGPIETGTAKISVDWREVGFLLAAGSLGALLFKYFNAPAAAFFGAMTGSVLVYGSGLLSTDIPTWTLEPAFVATGVIVGGMIAKTERCLIAPTALAGFGSLLVGTAIAFVFAYPVADVLGLPLAQVWLAYAPGGADSMTVLTIAFGLDAAYVGALHVARFIGLALFVPWWVSDIKRAVTSQATEQH